jgi:DNA replication protein DnaC
VGVRARVAGPVWGAASGIRVDQRRCVTRRRSAETSIPAVSESSRAQAATTRGPRNCAAPPTRTTCSPHSRGFSAPTRFPRVKRLADFDLSPAPTVNAATIATLAAGAYLEAGEPIVLLGESGTGKSHLLIGLGIAACEHGRRVRYATAAQLVNELAEAADERRLSRIIARYGRLDLLCLDELGYVQLDGRGSELLFQILTEREEKASVAVASNLPFSEWGTIIPDPRLVAAIVDRVTFNAHIIETGADSYRLRTTKARGRRKTA